MGYYRPVAPGQEYPPDLASYPDFGEGWMNEEGIRIKTRYRPIPTPWYSILKPPRRVPFPVTTTIAVNLGSSLGSRY